MRITQVTTVKDRREHIDRHISRWMSSGIDELVIVDYACPEKTGAHLLKDHAYGHDPRITVVFVPREGRTSSGPMLMAGDQFHLTRARNTGALAARHELLFFCDADCWVTSLFVSRIKHQAEVPAHMLLDNDACGRSTAHEGLPDCWLPNYRACDEAFVNAELPLTWVKDGQCVIRQHVFRQINGYNENHREWGGESYDMYLRAVEFGANVAVFDPAYINILPHSDDLRTQHLISHFDDADARALRYRRSARVLKSQRRLERTNCGKTLGFPVKCSSSIRLFRGGVERAWRPGEDDYN